MKRNNAKAETTRRDVRCPKCGHIRRQVMAGVAEAIRTNGCADCMGIPMPPAADRHPDVDEPEPAASSPSQEETVTETKPTGAKNDSDSTSALILGVLEAAGGGPLRTAEIGARLDGKKTLNQVTATIGYLTKQGRLERVGRATYRIAEGGGKPTPAPRPAKPRATTPAPKPVPEPSPAPTTATEPTGHYAAVLRERDDMQLELKQLDARRALLEEAIGALDEALPILERCARPVDEAAA